MEPIKFHYCNKEYYFKTLLIFTGTSDFDLKYNKPDQHFLKLCRNYSIIKWKSDEELLNNMIIKILPKPKTFPVFNNEQPFQLKFNGKIIKNPRIIAIRWTGYIWEYRIKNIGHEYDYQPESSLEKI
jgi:hypothetical protein